MTADNVWSLFFPSCPKQLTCPHWPLCFFCQFISLLFIPRYLPLTWLWFRRSIYCMHILRNLSSRATIEWLRWGLFLHSNSYFSYAFNPHSRIEWCRWKTMMDVADKHGIAQKHPRGRIQDGGSKIETRVRESQCSVIPRLSEDSALLLKDDRTHLLSLHPKSRRCARTS